MVSFFTKAPRAVPFAVTIVVLVGLQVTFGLMAHGMTFLALLHGLNALLIFGTALIAGRTVGRKAVQNSTPAMSRV